MILNYAYFNNYIAWEQNEDLPMEEFQYILSTYLPELSLAFNELEFGVAQYEVIRSADLENGADYHGIHQDFDHYTFYVSGTMQMHCYVESASSRVNGFARGRCGVHIGQACANGGGIAI